MKFTVASNYPETTAEVYLCYISSDQMILFDVNSELFSFQYEFNIVTRPFIINTLESLLGRINHQVIEAMGRILDQNPEGSLQEIVQKMLEKVPKLDIQQNLRTIEPKKINPKLPEDNVTQGSSKTLAILFGSKFQIILRDANNILDL